MKLLNCIYYTSYVGLVSGIILYSKYDLIFYDYLGDASLITFLAISPYKIYKIATAFDNHV